MAELAIIVAIVLVLSAVAIAEYSRTLPHRRLKADAVDLATNMRYARLTALRVNLDVGIHFDVSRGTYSIFLDKVNSGEFDAIGDDVISTKRDITLRAGIAFNPQNGKWTVNYNNVIIFRSNGTANTASGTVVLCNQNQEIRTVIVSPITGRIRVGS